MTKPVIRVCISGAAGQICYSVLFRIAAGDMLGYDQPVHIVMLEVPTALKAAEGVAMELVDCAFPLLSGFSLTSDNAEAFKDADYCLLFGAFPRKAGMERAELLSKNKGIFQVQGAAINQYAKPTCKILVIGNPANTNALVLSTQLTNIPKTNVTAMSRLDHNRAVGQVAAKLGVRTNRISNVWVAGNHSNTMVPIVDSGVIYDEDIKNKKPVKPMLSEEWIKKEFVPCVRGRGTAVIEARGHSSSASAANAAIDHIRDWHMGTKPGVFVSCSLLTEEGNPYGIAPGIFYSMPCNCVDGKWQIVKLDLPKEILDDMKASETELMKEAKDALK